MIKAGMTLLLVVFTASCAEQDVKDSGAVAARMLCHSARNCTVEDEGNSY